MELSVKERLLISGVLPQQGNMVTLKIVRQLKEDLSFSEEEIKEANIRSIEGGGFRWDKEITKDVQIGEKAMDVIVEALKDFNNKKQLSIDHLDVYEKFVEEEK